MKKITLLLLTVLCLSACGSTKPHCPTYSQAPAMTARPDSTHVIRGPKPNKVWVVAFVGVAIYLGANNLDTQE